MKRLIFIFLTVVVAFPLKAQSIFSPDRLALDKWHDGEVMLRTGEVLEGSINFNYLMDIVRVKTDNSELAYNRKQLLEFWVYKPEEERKVFYKSLDLHIGDQIYEVVGEDDEKALLVATVIDTQVYSAPDIIGPNGTILGTGTTQTVQRKAEAFYIITNEGTIYELGRIVITRNSKGQLGSTIKRKKLAQVLKQFKPDIEDYLKANKINLKKRPQLIQTFKSILNEH